MRPNEYLLALSYLGEASPPDPQNMKSGHPFAIAVRTKTDIFLLSKEQVQELEQTYVKVHLFCTILSVQFSDEHLPWMSRDIIKVQQLVGLSVWYMFLFVESKKKKIMILAKVNTSS